MVSSRLAWIVSSLLCAGVGCNLVTGLSDLKLDESGGAGGTGGSGGSTTTVGGSTGTVSTTDDGCSDGSKNGLETGRDCGGPNCAPCPLDEGCKLGSDCESGICRGPEAEKKCFAAVKIAAGNAHACAILADSTVHCWGANAHGQLGKSGGGVSSIPVEVSIAGAIEVTVGGPAEEPEKGHTCVRTQNNAVWCWGAGESGQLGNGGNSDVSDPVEVAGLGPVTNVSAGSLTTCIRKMAGTIACWGSSARGEINEALTDSNVPEDLAKPMAATSVTLGDHHVCALLPDSSVACWGANERGQSASTAGDIVGVNGVEFPVPVSNSQLALGQDFSCALSDKLFCWGDNTDGALAGASGSDLELTPVEIALSGAVRIAAGKDGDTSPDNLGGPTGGHACAITDNGTVMCWGNNRKGQLGNGSTSEKEITPVNVNTLEGGTQSDATGATDIALGAEFSCAVTTKGGVVCWGRNDRGQAGQSTQMDVVTTPQKVVWP
ncbi:MAG: hypothetical protein IPK82_01785 [Polyangiaceae bacterium]|nr:hypothetical protein [Polyangiaceae bacterium]